MQPRMQSPLFAAARLSQKQRFEDFVLSLGVYVRSKMHSMPVMPVMGLVWWQIALPLLVCEDSQGVVAAGYKRFPLNHLVPVPWFASNLHHA